MWESWLYLLAVAFVVVVLFYTFTPFLNTLTDTVGVIGNFTSGTTNTSFHNMLTYNSNLWNLWPIAAFVIIIIMLFYFASGEDEYKSGGV